MNLDNNANSIKEGAEEVPMRMIWSGGVAAIGLSLFGWAKPHSAADFLIYGVPVAVFLFIAYLPIRPIINPVVITAYADKFVIRRRLSPWRNTVPFSDISGAKRDTLSSPGEFSQREVHYCYIVRKDGTRVKVVGCDTVEEADRFYCFVLGAIHRSDLPDANSAA